MKEIATVNLNNARNAEHFQFHANVLTFATEALAIELKIESLQKSYANHFRNEDELYMRNRAYEETQTMNEKDRERDDLFIHGKKMLSTMSYSPVPAQKEAAQKINFIWDPFKHASSKPAAENTAEISNLIQELEKEKNKAYVATLGLTEVIAMLKKVNEEFNEIYVNRSDAKLVRVSNDTMKEARRLVDDDFRAMAKTINALWLVNDTVTKDAAMAAKLGGLIDNINAIILQFSETLSRRKASKPADIPADPKPVDPKPTDPADPEDPNNPPSGGDDGGGDDRPEIE